MDRPGSAASSSSSHLIPLRIPVVGETETDLPASARLTYLRERLRVLEGNVRGYEKVSGKLKEITDEPRWDHLVPLGPLACVRGQLVHTNTITVRLGGGKIGPSPNLGKGKGKERGDDDAMDVDDGGDLPKITEIVDGEAEEVQMDTGGVDMGEEGDWFVEKSAKQALELAKRRIEESRAEIECVRQEILAAQQDVKKEFGLEGGWSIGAGNEVLNEEGLPIFDIAHPEEDEKRVEAFVQRPRTERSSDEKAAIRLAIQRKIHEAEEAQRRVQRKEEKRPVIADDASTQPTPAVQQRADPGVEVLLNGQDQSIRTTATGKKFGSFIARPNGSPSTSPSKPAAPTTSATTPKTSSQAVHSAPALPAAPASAASSPLTAGKPATFGFSKGFLNKKVVSPRSTPSPTTSACPNDPAKTIGSQTLSNSTPTPRSMPERKVRFDTPSGEGEPREKARRQPIVPSWPSPVSDQVVEMNTDFAPISSAQEMEGSSVVRSSGDGLAESTSDLKTKTPAPLAKSTTSPVASQVFERRPAVVESGLPKSKPKITAMDEWDRLAAASRRRSSALEGEDGEDPNGVQEMDEDDADEGYGEEVQDDDEDDEDDDEEEGDEMRYSDEESDGLDIDDVMEARRWALDYHRKRQELGIGQGLGALAGDEVANDNEWDREFVPLEASLVPAPGSDSFGPSKPKPTQSRFRTGRLPREDIIQSSILVPTVREDGTFAWPDQVGAEGMSEEDRRRAERMLSLLATGTAGDVAAEQEEAETTTPREIQKPASRTEASHAFTKAEYQDRDRPPEVLSSSSIPKTSSATSGPAVVVASPGLSPPAMRSDVGERSSGTTASRPLPPLTSGTFQPAESQSQAEPPPAAPAKKVSRFRAQRAGGA